MVGHLGGESVAHTLLRELGFGFGATACPPLFVAVDDVAQSSGYVAFYRPGHICGFVALQRDLFDWCAFECLRGDRWEEEQVRLGTAGVEHAPRLWTGCGGRDLGWLDEGRSSESVLDDECFDVGEGAGVELERGDEPVVSVHGGELDEEHAGGVAGLGLGAAEPDACILELPPAVGRHARVGDRRREKCVHVSLWGTVAGGAESLAAADAKVVPVESTSCVFGRLEHKLACA